jgi:hypothetical protein
MCSTLLALPAGSDYVHKTNEAADTAIEVDPTAILIKNNTIKILVYPTAAFSTCDHP